MKILIRDSEQSDLGLHCLPRPICRKTLGSFRVYPGKPRVLYKVGFKWCVHIEYGYINMMDFKKMSCIISKPAFCIREHKVTEQLRSNCAADQCLCFCFIDSTPPLLPKSEISSLYPSSVAVQSSLCPTGLETPKTGFLLMRFSEFHNIG